MKRTSKLFRLILIIILYTSSLYSSELYKFVAWKNIVEASGYQIQIKDKKGTVIVDKKIEKNYYPVQDLAVGDYLVRTAPLNIFKKPVVWSPWKEMEVLISEIPKVDFYKDKPTLSLKPTETDKTVSPISSLEIDGQNFLEVTELEISHNNRKLPIVEKQLKNDHRIDVKVDTTNAAPGDYDLTIINPFQKPQQVAKFLKIEQKSNPSNTTTTPTIIEKIPTGKPLHTYTYPEFMAYLNANRPKHCLTSKVPEPALAECYKTYVTLNLKTKDNKDIFGFYNLISENEQDRVNGYHYFENKCKPVFRPAKERMKDFLDKNRGNLDPEEIGSLENSLQKLNSCPE